MAAYSDGGTCGTHVVSALPRALSDGSAWIVLRSLIGEQIPLRSSTPSLYQRRGAGCRAEGHTS